MSDETAIAGHHEPLLLPLVAIVGRPNVGKSTLFNRMIRRRSALVADEAGLTRDRHYALTEWESRTFQVVDTGGFELDAADDLSQLVRQQTEIAIAEADLVLLVVDTRAGMTANDLELLEILRRRGRRFMLVANKVDGPKQEPLTAELYASGVEHVLAVSAEHGRGFDELVDAILEALPSAVSGARAPTDVALAPDPGAIRVALVGRPNAGKSALLNRLSGQERAIVSDIPGTTRDPIDVAIRAAAGAFVLVDTAGIRRKHRSAPVMEQLAVLRAQRAIYEADVACLLIDATQPIAAQDAKIASLAVESGRGLVLVFTKSDLFRDLTRERRRLAALVEEKLRFAAFAPQLFLSAREGKHVSRLLPTIARVHRQCGRRVATAELNRFLEEITASHPPPSHHGRPVRLYYITQADTRPPTFIVSTNYPAAIPESYKRYLANRIREAFEFGGTPLRVFLRGKGPAGTKR